MSLKRPKGIGSETAGTLRGRRRRFPVLYDLVGFTGSGLAHARES